MKDPRRALPAVDALLAEPAISALLARLPRSLVVRAIRDTLDSARQAGGDAPTQGWPDAVAARVARLAAPSPARVVNATGVVLHTNLGRAVLAERAVAALTRVASGYSALEYDLERGTRGSRSELCRDVLVELTGAEDALIVNNAAAALLLTLSGLARGGEAIVSRGELIEIGGGFRIPEVLARSGARMVEVGTTNKTREADYARALEEERDVVAILRVHPGNFRQLGFVERPSLETLVGLAHARQVVVIEDLGGGLLVDLGVTGLQREPLVRASIAAGTDLVCFSTDKALGGPQGGAVVGRAALVEKLRRDPLARALRMGRLPLVALEATLGHLLRGELDAIPALAALRVPTAQVRARAEAWSRALGERGVACEVVTLDAVAGGGAFAEERVPSAGVALEGDAERWLARLRTGEPPVVARIETGRVVLDARTVLPGEDEELLTAVVRATPGED